jgi:hypothetical protein
MITRSKLTIAAVAVVLASLMLSASASAADITSVNACTRWTGNTTSPSAILINFTYAYNSVTPGTRVYYMLNRYTSSGWQYTGQWQSLTAQSDPYAASGIKWVYQDGYALVGHTVTFRLPHASGYYYVSWQVVVGGVASRVASISPYDNFVNLSETGWTSSCQP